ncbi:MAG: hypothetical protein WCH05_04985 [Chlorobiaceae bacterium]
MKIKEICLTIVVIALLLVKAGKAEGKTIILGNSKIIVPHGALIGTQVDRVIRDIAWKDSGFDENIDPQRVPANKAQLVPYMEGFLAGLLMDYAGARIEGMGPCQAKRTNRGIYADDGKGEFKFLVDPGKAEYRTAKDIGSGKILMADTHGFSMIAGSAIRRAEKAPLFMAMACMDLPSKAAAALYLAENGINCFGPCDRLASTLIGYRERSPNAATIIGTAPVRPLPEGMAVIGDQPISIDSEEQVIVQNTNHQFYPNQYADAPNRYFKALDKKYSLRMKLVTVQADPGQAENLVNEADKRGAAVIAVRVWNENDAKAIATWLEKEKKNRAVLFHSAIYAPGYALFAKFRQQTSFGDLSPVIR